MVIVKNLLESLLAVTVWVRLRWVACRLLEGKGPKASTAFISEIKHKWFPHKIVPKRWSSPLLLHSKYKVFKYQLVTCSIIVTHTKF